MAWDHNVGSALLTAAFAGLSLRPLAENIPKRILGYVAYHRFRPADFTHGKSLVFLVYSPDIHYVEHRLQAKKIALGGTDGRLLHYQLVLVCTQFWRMMTRGSHRNLFRVRGHDASLTSGNNDWATTMALFP